MKNYFNYSFYLTASVILILTVVAIVSPSKVFGFKLKQANIYSEVVSDSTIREFAGLEGDPFVYTNRSIATLNESSELMYDLVDSLRVAVIAAKQVQKRAAKPVPKGVVALQDFSEDGYHLASFFKKLDKARGDNVRIAVLGDSFIEGDIMTADMREMFQLKYSGAGVGYMPITSQVAKFRGSVIHKFSDNWKDNVIIKDQTQKYMLSGHSFVVSKGDEAWVEYQGNKYRKNLEVFNQATLLFVNTGSTKIRVIVNDGEAKEFEPDVSAEMQSIVVKDSIHKVRFEFSETSGFTAYGALLDDSVGVSMDNYSVRGNSGVGMTAINAEICNEMSKVAPYDLIILEYGLNVVEDEVTSYGTYRNKMTAVVEHIKICYPGVPIVIMGVSDRSTQKDGEYVTMEGVKGMDYAQKELARRCGVAYWSTLDAMRSLGGMPKFVEYGWAAKDYTHIGSGGGRKIGQKFFEAIIANR